MTQRFIHILACGGSLFSKERQCLDSCELLSFCCTDSQFNVSSKTVCNLLCARRGAAKFYLKNKFLLVGGCANHGHQNSSEILVPINFTKFNHENFVKLPNTSISCAAYCSLNSKEVCAQHLIIGGWNGKECLKSVYSLDENLVQEDRPLQTDKSIQWTLLADLPLAIKNACAVAYLENIYIIGGWDESRTLDTVFKYRPSDGGTTELFCRLPYPIECHCCELFISSENGKNIVRAYIFGGFDGIKLRNDIVELDLLTKNSKIIDNCLLSEEKECMAPVKLNDSKIAILGGWNGYSALKTVEIFDVDLTAGCLRNLFVEKDVLVDARNRPNAFLLNI